MSLVWIRLAGGIVLAGACCCLSAQLVYVPNRNEGTISIYVVNPEVGTMAEGLPRAKTPGQPVVAAGMPGGKFLYVASEGSRDAVPNVAAYAINGSTGALSPVPGSPYNLGGTPMGVQADPGGRFVYVALQSSSTAVAGFAVNASNGALTRIAATSVGTGGGPSGLAVSPSGKYLCVTNQRSNNIAVFAVDSGTGTLTQVPGSPFAAGTGPLRPVFDPAGKFLYVPNQAGNNVSVFSMDATSGALSQVAGSPFAAGAGPNAVAVDPSGKWLVVSNGNDSTLSVFSIDADKGTLTPAAVPAVSARRAPVDVVIDPSGKYLYVSALLDNCMSSYLMDPASGALTPAPAAPYPGGSGPMRMALVQPATPIPPPVLVRSVVNGASFVPTVFPNSGIARGSTFALNGINFGPAAGVKATDFPLGRQLAGTSVQVTVGDTTRDAILVSTSVTQVLAILPSDVPAGDGRVTVAYNGRQSPATPIRVVDAAPGVFTRAGTGAGPAAARNQTDGGEADNTFTDSARPGQAVVLSATGLGPVTFDETQPAAPQNLRDDVEVWVGNRGAKASFTGRSPDYPGVDKVVFTLPDDVPAGCYVPVAIKLGQTVSNFATISVAPAGKTCSDRHALSAADFPALADGQTATIGWIQLLRMNYSATVPGLGTATGLVDTGWAEFFRWDAASAISDSGLDLFTGRTVSLGTCSVARFLGGGPSYHPLRTSFLNAGVSLNVSAGSATGTLVQSPYGFYDAHKAFGVIAPPGIGGRSLPPPFLEPGIVKVDNAQGTTQTGRFSGSLTIPANLPPLAWTNLDRISASGIDRAAGVTFTWEGGDAENEYVILGGAIVQPGNFSDPIKMASGFVCAEKAGAGQFTVPAAVLQALPASNPAAPTSGMLMLGRAPFLGDSLKFSATGFDRAYLTNAVFNGTLVTYR